MKKTSMLFRAQFQTQTCFETAQSVWVPKHWGSQKYFFSISIQLKLRKKNTKLALKSMFRSLMIYVITCLFNTFALIYMLCNCCATFSNTIKSINYDNGFDSHFKSLIVSLSSVKILIKRYEKNSCLSAFNLQRATVFQRW